MPRRPTNLAKFIRSTVSLLGGILLEMVFVLWFILLIFGAAAVAVFLSNLVS
jgi:hypothetical protein